MSAYSTVIGATARRTIPRPLRAPLYRAFAAAVGARLDEVGAPLPTFASFGDFFARPLQAGARPVASAPLVSPCDGAIGAAGMISEGTLLQAKGHDYALRDLVVDDALAARLAGGQFATIYLSPRDYHRVHAPAAGRVTGYHYVPGLRWPVSPRFVDHVERLFAVNERVVIELETAWGPMAVVMVAATGVGNVWLTHAGHDTRAWRRRGDFHCHRLAASVEAGDELGAFLLGSTVVMVLPPGAPPLALPAAGGSIRCGAALVAPGGAP
ncbi:MAG: phosphatidylserine decarboxylase [Myxococcales bacterium]|nr:phosphatidylserine decarboxylase [Myxococcales bacterium]